MKKSIGPGVAGVLTGGIKKSAVKKAVSQGADLLELRVDTFRNRELAALGRSVKSLKDFAGLPLLLTVRSKKEGGAGDLSDEERAGIFAALIPMCDYVDIELSSSKILKTVVGLARRNKKKVIISYHNFNATPAIEKIQDIIDKSRASGADIVKIAALARAGQDLKRLARVLCDSQGLIVIAMGAVGRPSRVFFPFLGSLITYAGINAGTAPGQMSLTSLKKELKVYGL